MNTYMSGSLVRTKATFTDITGANADPTTTTLKYKSGAGSTQTPAPVHDSTGVFHYDIDTTGFTGPDALIYTIEWIGTGTVQAIAVDNFEVVPAAI